jgi:hypothetical protein
MLRRRLGHIPYQWIALSNTTLGAFMASLDGSIVQISLPAIFHGIGINPLAPGETDYLLWTLMGYLVVTATLLVTFGRISDMFAAPNTTAIMNSVPAEHRGVSSGMRATFQNTANTLSITLIFTMVMAGLAVSLPKALNAGLTQAGIPTAVAAKVANLPPTAALFAAFLGYNPMGVVIPPDVLRALPAAAQANLTGKTFFPTMIAGPFEQGLRIAFAISVVLSLLAALASLMRGERYIYDHAHPLAGRGGQLASETRPASVTLRRAEEEEPG